MKAVVIAVFSQGRHVRLENSNDHKKLHTNYIIKWQAHYSMPKVFKAMD